VVGLPLTKARNLTGLRGRAPAEVTRDGDRVTSASTPRGASGPSDPASNYFLFGNFQKFELRHGPAAPGSHRPSEE